IHRRLLPDAEAVFRKAVVQRHDCAEAHDGLAKALDMQDKTKDAVAAYHSASRLYTDKAKAAQTQINLGNCLAQHGFLPEAEKEFRRAVDLQPKWPEPRYNLAMALGQQGQWKEAITSCRKAVEMKPDYGAAWGFLGFALYKDGQNGEALKALK